MTTQPPEMITHATGSEVSPSVQPNGPSARNKLRQLYVQLQLLLDPMPTVAKRFAHYGDVYRVQNQGSAPLYVFRHPDHIKEILVSQAGAFDKSHSAFRRLSLVLGDALLTSDGERWRRQRRLVQPAFSRQRLMEYSTDMVTEAARCVEHLGRGGQFALGHEMNTLTLGIVTRTLFGQTMDEGRSTGQAMLELNRWFGTPPILMRFIPRAKERFTAAQAALDGAIEALISRRQAAADGGRDLLSALMSSRDEGEALTPRELRDQLLTLYVAGHETTSHALTWTLYLLCRHPDVLARLDAEHDAVLAGRLPTFEDLSALPYTEQVIKEALRMYPPAYVLPRRVAKDVTIGPYRLPRGAEVVIWTYQTHHDARWYPEPERFRPERFAPDAESVLPKFAYVPFGAGQRACIGQMFAMIEAQLVLATLLPRLRFEYAARRAPRLGLGVTLAPKNGMPMRVSARQR